MVEEGSRLTRWMSPADRPPRQALRLSLTSALSTTFVPKWRKAGCFASFIRPKGTVRTFLGFGGIQWLRQLHRKRQPPSQIEQQSWQGAPLAETSPPPTKNNRARGACGWLEEEKRLAVNPILEDHRAVGLTIATWKAGQVGTEGQGQRISKQIDAKLYGNSEKQQAGWSQ